MCRRRRRRPCRTTTSSSGSSSSASRRGRPRSPAPPSSASAGSASSPTPDSTASSAPTTGNPRSSASSSASTLPTSPPRWILPTAYPPRASPCRCPATTPGTSSAAATASLLNRTRLEITVWDPVSGDQRRVAFPPGWFRNDDASLCVRNAALLCDNGHSGRVPLQGFKVVLLRHDWPVDEDSQAFASLYESETGVWGDLISTSIKAPLSMTSPSILVGNSLCWPFLGYEDGGILDFDLDKHTLAVIKHPVGGHDDEDFQILQMEDSGLGLAISSGMGIQLWERKTDSRGVARWMLQKTIGLDKLLSLRSPMERSWQVFLGYDEDGHVIFVSIAFQVFVIQLKSMQFKNLFKSNIITAYHPYRSFYATGRATGSGDGTLSKSNTGDGCP